MTVLLAAAALAVALYLAAVATLFVAQRRFVFVPGGPAATAAEAGLAPDFRDVVLDTADGERLAAWWKPPAPGRAVVLYLHGNGGSLWNRRFRAEALGREGRGVLLLAYRGYPGSTGTPSEGGLRLDADAAWRWLGADEPGRIALYGESLGSGVAVKLATSRPVGALILDSPFTSLVEVARASFPLVPLRLLMRDQFRSLDRIARLPVPLLVLHGERDGIVPVALSERLFAAAPEPKRRAVLPGVDHVSVLERGGLPIVSRFLDEMEARWRAEPGARLEGRE